jgi:hypothetical protein
LGMSGRWQSARMAGVGPEAGGNVRPLADIVDVLMRNRLHHTVTLA